MQALTNIRTFRTIVDDNPQAFADIFPYLPELEELSVTVKRSLDNVLSALAFGVPLNRRHLKRINITYNAANHHLKGTISLNTIRQLTSGLRASWAIQELRIRTVEGFLFAESHLVKLVKSAKSIRSLEHLGIPCAVNANGDLDRYLAPICKTHLLSKMTEGKKKKFFIRLTLYPKTISSSPEKTCFLRRH
ncbi:uncharacterized protein LOC135154850 [Lytechinus pictus]|uniref:uncharacterized protein LOC135154850 n=1 Tax=Lytechinus pictus TaxID=7653 RepID=UPI0030B9F3A7